MEIIRSEKSNLTCRDYPRRRSRILIDTVFEIDIHESVRDSPTLEEIPVRKSNQLDEQEVLSNQGRTVLIMDHHNITRSAQFDNVIIVNNQTSNKFWNNKNWYWRYIYSFRCGS